MHPMTSDRRSALPSMSMVKEYGRDPGGAPRRLVYFVRDRASARRASEEYWRILSEPDDAIAKGSGERHQSPKEVLAPAQPPGSFEPGMPLISRRACFQAR